MLTMYFNLHMQVYENSKMSVCLLFFIVNQFKYQQLRTPAFVLTLGKVYALHIYTNTYML